MFEPRDFHAFAVRCVEQAPDEAAYRSAISRAYYAAYLTAHEYISAHSLRAIPAKGQRLGPHERTIQAISGIRHPGSSYVENELANLKRRRLSADYDRDYVEAELDAPGAISDAAMIIAWFDALSGPSAANRYSPAWFDLFLADLDPAQTAREVAFLKRNLPAPPASVLDVCCGYGRHAAPLAEAGYDVLGIDRDAAAIDRARASHAGARLTFETHDMDRLGDLPGSFDAAICMWQSFGYGDAAANAEVLRQLAAHLRPGGRLVLDIYNRDFFESRQGERETTPRGETVVTRQHLEGDRLIVDLQYPERGGNDRFDWQVFSPASIAALADQCGLQLELACTGFDEALPPSPDAPRMQFVFTPA